MPSTAADYKKLMESVTRVQRKFEPLDNGNCIELAYTEVETSRGIQIWPVCVSEITASGEFVCNAVDHIEALRWRQAFQMCGLR